MKILGSKMTTQAQAKHVLDQREKEGELVYEQKIALEFLKKHLKLEHKEAEKLLTAIKEASPELTEEQIVALADFMPKDKEDLRVVLARERFNLTDEAAQKILSAFSSA
jgi:DNA-directed RNA polymerase subunit F